ncbi:MAG: coenzyme F420-0:L-glutamate ligase [Anaerolineales bacterium]|jgi:coenzyme F420-0:L-glutamate ligase/coenzyme F420-1:gamma-L-glutamate ligase
MSVALTLTPLKRIPLIQPRDDLVAIILTGLRDSQITLQNNDILVLAQKIISKAEGRQVNITTVDPSADALAYAAAANKDPKLVELILRESREVLRVRPGLMIVEHRLGFICANAGIDHSNVSPPDVFDNGLDTAEKSNPDDWVLLLPENPDQSAEKLRKALEAEIGMRLGVAIIDSHGRAWRNGVVGVTIGISGIPGVVDKRGEKDLFGYELKATEIGTADELAAAASLMMGQVAEGTPIVHVRGFPYPLREAGMGELIRSKEMDLFR